MARRLKLDKEKIKEIETLYSQGYNAAEIGRRLRVSQSCAWAYCHGFSPKEYNTNLIKQRGFSSLGNYELYLAMIKGSDSPESFQGGLRQKEFEERMEKTDFGVFYEIASKSIGVEQKAEQEEVVEIIKRVLEELEKGKGGGRLRRIIEERFFNGESYRNLEEKFGVVHERVRQLEKRALKKMGFLGRKFGLEVYAC